MECIVFINDYTDNTAYMLHRKRQGYPEYAGALVKHLLNTFPYDKVQFKTDLLIDELTLHEFDPEYSLIDNYVDESGISENTVLPNKYVYLIVVMEDHITYECKRINAVNFPAYEHINEYDTIESLKFKK